MKYIKIFLAISVLFVQCAKIKINFRDLEETPTYNWHMYGGNPARTNFSPVDISLPLELQWRYNASSAIGKALIVNNGIVYFPTMDGRLYAVDIESGKKIGHKKIGIDATCAFHDTSLFIASRYGEETLFKYNLKRAKNDWEIDAGDIASEPLPLDNSVAITALYQHIDLYDVTDGSKIWQMKTDDQIRSSPACHLKTIVFGCDNGLVYAVDQVSGSMLWKFKTQASVLSTPAIKDSIVYVGSSDKNFYAINLKTGKLIWSLKTDGQILHSPAVNDQVVVFGSTDSHLYCLDRFSGSRIWSFEAESVVSTSPLISKNSVFFGSLDHHYYALDLKTGKETWKYKTRGRVKTAPVIWDKYLIGASENNHVYAFTFSGK